MVADIGVDAVKVGMLGDRETTLAVAAALDELPRGVPVVVDPVMVAESGARLLAPDAHEALVRGDAAARERAHAERARGAGAAGRGAAARAPTTPRPSGSRASVLALGPARVVLTGGHRETATDLLVAGAAVPAVAIAGPRHPDGAAHGSGCTHSAALAAPLALGESARAGGAQRARRSPARRSRAGCASSARAPGPVDAIGLRDRREGVSGGARPFAIIGRVRLLRMKPGHGEIVLAEGDVEVPEQERELIEAFRRELDAGMWAAVPDRARPAGAARPSSSRSFDEVPRDAERVIFFPRAAGGAPMASAERRWGSRWARRRWCSSCCVWELARPTVMRAAGASARQAWAERGRDDRRRL